MSRNSMSISKCPHMDHITQMRLSDLCKKRRGYPCKECDANGPNLWICLQMNCFHTGCSELYNDHGTKHFETNQMHCIQMNLSSQRIWCYLCKTEVFVALERQSSLPTDTTFNQERINGGDSCDSSGNEDENYRRRTSGLVGLQNIANTCYMNAALQALSNSPPLTRYFLECGPIIEAASEQMIGAQKKPGLAKSYHRLMEDIWCQNRRGNGYVVPNGILYGIRSVHPMFRGYQQHDTQEFLRCFMDQLHEELKEVISPPPDIMSNDQDDRSECSSLSSSQSEGEYETCDSGVSEQSSLSDCDVSNRSRRDHQMNHHSPSPMSSQRNIVKQLSSSLPMRATSVSSSFTSGTGSSAIGGQGSIQSENDQQDTMIGSGNSNSNSNGSSKSPPHHSIISDVFDGKLLSSVQCLTCNRVSTREETFQDLSLPIPGKDHLAMLHKTQGIVGQPISGILNRADVAFLPFLHSYQAIQDGWILWLWNWIRSWFWGPAVSLHDCMSAFFSADELKGDNMYSCDRCKKLRNGIKFSRVLALPEMLCVHLKRFRHDLSYSSKISSPVNFPLTGFDMRPYINENCKSMISTYDLTAVICHHGTVGGGHYTSFAQHEPTGQWFEYDDQLVTQVAPEVVQSCEAYVLFYRKHNPAMTILRSQAHELMNSSPQEAANIKFFVSRQWLNRFHTFAEPGPIDNWALLCPHGGLSPCKASLVNYLVVELPQPLWEFFYAKFGGGPACNHLFECDTCRHAADQLSRRQKAELDAFTAYNDEFQLQDNANTIYAISMAWLRQWQMFARGMTNDEPGPINNATIAVSTDVRSVKPGSDYAQINTALWHFFHGIYGGGPEIVLRGCASPEQYVERVRVERPPSECEPMDQEADIECTRTGTKTFTKSPETEVVPPPPPPPTPPPPPPPPPPLPPSSSLPQQQCGDKISDAAELSLKVTKTVSFEDGDCVGASSSPPMSNGFSSDIDYQIRNNSDDHVDNQTATDHIGKKAQRYRGALRSHGMFGVEGKYSDYVSNKSGADELSPSITAIETVPTIAAHVMANNSCSAVRPASPDMVIIDTFHSVTPSTKPTSTSTASSTLSTSTTTSLSAINHRKSAKETTVVDVVTSIDGQRHSSNRKKAKSKHSRKLANSNTNDSYVSHAVGERSHLSDSDK